MKNKFEKRISSYNEQFNKVDIKIRKSKLKLYGFIVIVVLTGISLLLSQVIIKKILPEDLPKQIKQPNHIEFNQNNEDINQVEIELFEVDTLKN